MSLIIIFSMLVGLTASTAQSPQPVAQPITLNSWHDRAEVVAALPREETLYFNGQQWGSVVGWNPYSDRMNNAMAIAQQDNARVTMFETPYIYNMLTVSSSLCWRMVLTHGMMQGLRSPSRSNLPHIGAMAPR